MSKNKPASPAQLRQKSGTTLGGYTKVKTPTGFVMKPVKKGSK
jgi:hypothetical protein